ncbi:MAG: tetratricopeptide repeat protein [Turicibacter sp.]|nr:tetratricopeptide repeat protein [Turicibacter sp.]
MGLLLSLTQQEVSHPYRFSGTGIQVYSFEEVLYHVYHYWKQSVDDVTEPSLVAWVTDTLGLTRIATKMNEVAHIEQFSERMLAFLEIAPYFSTMELAALKPDLIKWERRLEWETYKERADDLVARGEPAKSIALYRRALRHNENVRLLNNISVAYMQSENYAEAVNALGRALEINDEEQLAYKLTLNYCEALILAGLLERADGVLSQLEATAGEAADLLYMRGELAIRQDERRAAISFFERAIELADENNEHYIFSLADIYARNRQFERALELLAQKGSGSVAHLVKVAELHSLAANVPAAIRTMEEAIEQKPREVELWIKLARYHRMNYNLEQAESAIARALELDNANDRAKLEQARVQKGLGRIRAYQGLLRGVLAGVKGRYRGAYS